ncbi:MAG: exodeoxyribonuclease VII small subunit [Oscillospiraceae bacterium]|nr:exodeoxyribonuclease VII small subunit [Oscillospiraceae bacterium]
MATKTFEDSMTELENVVSKLEAGDVTLDESLKLFEQGIKLAKSCRKKLDEAEKKVKILTAGPDGEMIEEEFEASE